MTQLKADGLKAIDCLKDAEPKAIEEAKARIAEIVASGVTAENAKSEIEKFAIDEAPEVVGCAAFATSVSSKDAAAQVAAQYIADHGLTFTASPK